MNDPKKRTVNEGLISLSLNLIRNQTHRNQKIAKTDEKIAKKINPHSIP